MELFKVNVNEDVKTKEELCGFELDYPNVYLNGEKLEPEIASGIFRLQSLIQKQQKTVRERRKVSKNMIRECKEMKAHKDLVIEQNNLLLDKIRYYKTQVAALTKYSM